MPYTTRDATRTLFGYLGLNEGEVEFIPGTSNRAFIFNLPNGDNCVIFIYPISRKVDNTKNFFDTRDSGARERGIAWNYALTHNLKYFCIAVHDQFEKYVNYAFSLECNEQRVAQVAGTVDGRRNGAGTQVVIPSDFTPSKPFERILTRFGFYIGVAHKDFLITYLESYDNRPYMEQNAPVAIPDDDEEAVRVGAENILLYGVPGCGKSYTIKTEYCDDDDHMERAVFHPDYTYSDFVGQILPRVDEGHIEYRFEPGPFTRILKKAVETPDESFYLVVEEINRGNAPAIFGDIFQLLDRDESGCSEYGVSNENISNYVYGDATTKIKIPGNLFVLATMNTSDQNVSTLDTAFKRRWTMRMIKNDIDACEYAGHQIRPWGITW
ncbi:MAG: AAA family ATPase, partial [Bacteroidaceae bacterium]|nr:AAA family ATPase [Bacteroidaceae bacterium]